MKDACFWIFSLPNHSIIDVNKSFQPLPSTYHCFLQCVCRDASSRSVGIRKHLEGPDHISLCVRNIHRLSHHLIKKVQHTEIQSKSGSLQSHTSLFKLHTSSGLKITWDSDHRKAGSTGLPGQDVWPQNEPESGVTCCILVYLGAHVFASTCSITIGSHILIALKTQIAIA